MFQLLLVKTKCFDENFRILTWKRKEHNWKASGQKDRERPFVSTHLEVAVDHTHLVAVQHSL